MKSKVCTFDSEHLWQSQISNLCNNDGVCVRACARVCALFLCVCRTKEEVVPVNFLYLIPVSHCISAVHSCADECDKDESRFEL